MDVEAVTGSRRRAPGLIDQLRLTLAAIAAALIGVAPHLLHHAGPLAGAALFAGFVGTALLGALGFLLMIPVLLRLRRRQGSWGLSAAVLALFVSMFLVSAFVIGPLITGGGSDESRQAVPLSQGEAHEAHH